MDYQAIFFDLDGTLAGMETHTIADSTREALATARAKGIKIFLATGRHPDHFSWGVLDGVEFDGFLTCNGQYCFNSQDIIFRKYIPDSDIQGLVDRLQVQAYPVLFIREEDTFINMITEHVQTVMDALKMNTPKIIDPITLDDPKIFSLLLCDGEENDQRTMSVMPGCTSVRWHPAFTDVIPNGGGKATGIDAMLTYYGIPINETMAFGDAQNDLSMLKHVGMGVAMGNAADLIKASADYVTDHVDCDGVWKALRHFGIV